MFGLFAKVKRVEKVNLNMVVAQMSKRLWDVELLENRPNAIVVNGKYRNHQREFKRLFIHFLGDQKIEFKDERGDVITHIPRTADRKDMFSHLKNILNVL